MPLAPYTWQTYDFLTASRLQAELRRVNGQQYQYNGVNFHANRPLLRSWGGPNSATATGWTSAYNPLGDWASNNDTLVLQGSQVNPAYTGGLTAQALANGGGVAGSGGGLALMFSLLGFTSNASGSAMTGQGFWNAGSPVSCGTVQVANSSYESQGWALDIVDWGAHQYSPFFNLSTTGIQPNGAGSSTDGSGLSARMQGMWASVYPANGQAFGSIPSPVTNWTSSSPSLTAAMMNSQFANVLSFLNMPPLLRVQATAGTSCTAATTTTINYGAATYDTYGGWSSGTDTYTVPLNGIYLVASFAGFDSFSTSSYLHSGVSVNGTDYMGPMNQAVSGQPAAAAKVQMFSLNAGDTITHRVQVGLSLTTSTTNAPIMVVLYLGAQGAPGTLPTVPDTSYNFTAGTPASAMPGVMNSYVANDLEFLLQKPYAMLYQTTSQSIPQTTPTNITYQVAQGMVHSDNGDNYSGVSSGVYTAQRSGYYLCVHEVQMATPSLTTNPQQCAAFATAWPGASATDYYQKQNARNTGTTGGGAAAVAIYYLSAGDSIYPQVWSGATASGNTSTYVGSPSTESHFELIWLAS